MTAPKFSHKVLALVCAERWFLKRHPGKQAEALAWAERHWTLFAPHAERLAGFVRAVELARKVSVN